MKLLDLLESVIDKNRMALWVYPAQHVIIDVGNMTHEDRILEGPSGFGITFNEIMNAEDQHQPATALAIRAGWVKVSTWSTDIGIDAFEVQNAKRTIQMLIREKLIDLSDDLVIHVDIGDPDNSSAFTIRGRSGIVGWTAGITEAFGSEKTHLPYGYWITPDFKLVPVQREYQHSTFLRSNPQAFGLTPEQVNKVTEFDINYLALRQGAVRIVNPHADQNYHLLIMATSEGLARKAYRSLVGSKIINPRELVGLMVDIITHPDQMFDFESAKVIDRGQMAAWASGQHLNESRLDEITRPRNVGEAGWKLITAGYKMLGRGSYGEVYSKQGADYVVKLFTASDVCYIRFLKFIAKNPNPHYPRIIGKPIKITDKYWAVRIEKLLPIPDDSELKTKFPSLMLAMNQKFSHEERVNLIRRDSRVFGPENAVMPNFGMSMYRAIAALRGPVLSPSCRGDIHWRNVMMRPDGTLVLADPSSLDSSTSVRESTGTPRVLYHGTTIDVAQNSRRLCPMIGDFVLWAHDINPESPSLDQDLRDQGITDLVFAADSKSLQKVVNAITHQVSVKLGKRQITQAEFFTHGALVVLHSPSGFVQRDEFDSDGSDHPYHVEPGDWYSDCSQSIDAVLTGDKLKQFLIKRKLWPNHHSQINETNPSVPKVLYHGTSSMAVEDIQETGMMHSSDHRDELAISFTTDYSAASRFADNAARIYGGDPVVIEFNGLKLAKKYKLEPFTDSGLLRGEAEWRIVGASINVKGCIIDVITEVINFVDDPITIQKNPPLRGIINRTKNKEELRGFIADGNVYIWNAYDGIHDDAMSELGLERVDWSFFITPFDPTKPPFHDHYEWNGYFRKSEHGFYLGAVRSRGGAVEPGQFIIDRLMGQNKKANPGQPG